MKDRTGKEVEETEEGTGKGREGKGSEGRKGRGRGGELGVYAAR